MGDAMSVQPMHQRVVEELRKDIASGELVPRQRLPADSDLAKRFGASVETIRLALEALASLGLVHFRPERGTFISGEVLPVMVQLSGERAVLGVKHHWVRQRSEAAVVETRSRVPQVTKLLTEVQAAMPYVAERLNIDTGTHVLLRAFWRTMEGQPWSIQTSYYPMDIAEGTKLMTREDIRQGTIEVLAELGHVQAGYRDQIWARMPQYDELEFLRLALHIPVLVVNRTAYDVKRRPIRLTQTVYGADRGRLTHESGEVPPDGEFLKE